MFMNFWETLIIALIPALFTAIITYFLAIKQNKNDLKKQEKQIISNLIEYQNKELLGIKREAIFNSLSLIDVYISWLTIDGRNDLAERKEIKKLELTELGRKCYNELCLTCNSQELINSFLDIFFKKCSNIFENYSKYRNLARKELGLKELNLDSDRVFIGKIGTDNMTK